MKKLSAGELHREPRRESLQSPSPRRLRKPPQSRHTHQQPPARPLGGLQLAPKPRRPKPPEDEGQTRGPHYLPQLCLLPSLLHPSLERLHILLGAIEHDDVVFLEGSPTLERAGNRTFRHHAEGSYP